MDEDLKQIKQINTKIAKAQKQLSDLDNQIWEIVKQHKDDDKESMIQLFHTLPECHAKFKLFRMLQQKNFI